MSKEYEDIVVKAMAYDLILKFNEKGKDAVYTPQEIEHIIIECVNKSLSENNETAGNSFNAVPGITMHICQ